MSGYKQLRYTDAQDADYADRSGDDAPDDLSGEVPADRVDGDGPGDHPDRVWLHRITREAADALRGAFPDLYFQVERVAMIEATGRIVAALIAADEEFFGDD